MRCLREPHRAGRLLRRPQCPHGALDPGGGYPATTAAQATAAADAPPGSVSSDTSPTSKARRAEIRSAVPMSIIRATSPYGIRCARSTDSYALTIPYVVCGSKKAASAPATTNSHSPSR